MGAHFTDEERVNDVNDYLKVGDTVPVKVLDDRQGRVRLSMKKRESQLTNEQSTEQSEDKAKINR